MKRYKQLEYYTKSIKDLEFQLKVAYGTKSYAERLQIGVKAHDISLDRGIVHNQDRLNGDIYEEESNGVLVRKLNHPDNKTCTDNLIKRFIKNIFTFWRS